jgi:hypothetical protein
LSIPERLFRLSKAYLGQVRERIDSELAGAERELDHEPEANSAAPGSDRSVSESEEMMRRAEERIAAVRLDLESRAEATRSASAAPARATSAPAAATVTAEADPNFHDYRVLGVPVGSDLGAVQAEYEKLSRRCDPRRFPEGSSEQKQAEQILGRINSSFEALRRRLDPTENRFGKLELE